MAGNYYRLHSNDFGHARSPKCIRETEECPKNADNWSFSPVHYSYSLKNLEEADRHWLVYSKSKLFCCKLISSSTVKIAKNAIYYWWHLTSYPEMDHVFRGTVEAHHQRLLNNESEHWKNILEHLIAVIHFLGQHCLPLRGSTDTLFQPDNRIFLKLVELLGKFDTVMMEHLHRTKQGESKGHHYLGKETKNQVIHLIRSPITNNVLLMMKSAKYYSIILDCTQDISKVEQMTVVVRFVQETRLHGVYDVQIWEHFLGFLPGPDSLCSTLMQVVLKFLEDKKILLCNMRGQERSFRYEQEIILCTIKKPIHFTYEGRDETIDDPTKRNKIEFYYYLLDTVITSLDERFSQLKVHCDYFDFLYDIDELKNTPPDSLDTKCRNLPSILQDHESSDIDALEWRDELKVLSTLLKPGIGPKEIL
ncbi:uncharacterized protein LOC124722641 [Schistocerca piceifrons]|uniref:uncharacterized protein LOC124722641 n=1 Tax=Schistocerca piceifrons TaxID=274613 RepID=UPI001F5E9617|nr:uncharacterized protein LOC124722641 [Schistocerca piceifrons]